MPGDSAEKYVGHRQAAAAGRRPLLDPFARAPLSDLHGTAVVASSLMQAITASRRPAPREQALDELLTPRAIAIKELMIRRSDANQRTGARSLAVDGSDTCSCELAAYGRWIDAMCLADGGGASPPAR